MFVICFVTFIHAKKGKGRKGAKKGGGRRQ
jgi:hypothetical protein